MHRKIRVGAVSYLNTKPLTYAFEQGLMADEISLSFDVPSRLASRLEHDQIDIGLVPVAVLPELQDYHVIPGTCIGALSHVASVAVFSKVPVEEITDLYLDSQSRTSVALTRILCREHWKISPRFLDAEQDYESKVAGTTAALIIGDRALKQRQGGYLIYDLAAAWNQMTGLPFVFACWVSNKKLSEEFMQRFNSATCLGLKHIPEIVKENPFPYYDLSEYYLRDIDYNLDEKKMKALDLFLQKLSAAVIDL